MVNFHWTKRWPYKRARLYNYNVVKYGNCEYNGENIKVSIYIIALLFAPVANDSDASDPETMKIIFLGALTNIRGTNSDAASLNTPRIMASFSGGKWVIECPEAA